MLKAVRSGGPITANGQADLECAASHKKGGQTGPLFTLTAACAPYLYSTCARTLLITLS